jgi:hypothetical protein
MLHFLPNKNKKEINEEYILRTFVFFFLFILISLFLLILLFIPTAIYSKYDNRTITDELALTESVNTSKGEDTVSLIKKLNGITKALAVDTTALNPTELLDKITGLKGSAIQITNIEIKGADTGTVSIQINGVAKTRDSLIAFNKSLQENSSFSNVTLPVANLIKDVNADFTITMTYTK